MAARGSNAEEKLRELLECPVCLDTYVNPRLLPCGHQFCEKCLLGLQERGRGGRLACPVCREVVTPESGDVARLPRAYLLQEVQDIVLATLGVGTDTGSGLDYPAVSSAQRQQLSTDVQDAVCQGDHQDAAGDDGTLMCDVHPDYPGEFFCQQCEKIVCEECVFDQCGEHDTRGLPDYIAACRATLAEHAAQRAGRELNMADMLDMAESAKQAIIGTEEEYVERLRNIRQAYRALQARIEGLAEGLRAPYGAEMEKLKESRRRVLGVREEQVRLLRVTEALLEDGTHTQLIAAAANMPCVKMGAARLEVTVPVPSRGIRDLAAHFTPAAITFTEQPAVYRAWRKQVSLRSTVRGAQTMKGVMYRADTGRFVLRLQDGPASMLMYDLDGTLVKEVRGGPGWVTKGNSPRQVALDTDRGLYLLPSTRGYLALMKEDGTVSAHRKLGTHLRGAAYLGPEQLYAVTDSDPHGGSVTLLSPETLDVVSTFRCEQSLRPNHICHGAVHGRRRLAVSDTHNNRVVVFNMAGEAVRTYGPEIEGFGRLDAPTGVCMDACGRLFVCDHGNSRVLSVWTGADEKSEHWECVLSLSPADPEQGAPISACIDDDGGHIIVMSANTLRVYKF